jgi:hypothetical protein
MYLYNRRANKLAFIAGSQKRFNEASEGGLMPHGRESALMTVRRISTVTSLRILVHGG